MGENHFLIKLNSNGVDYKYQGIILGKCDVGETDRIYTIYTLEMGKIRTLGKGVRKPNAKLAGSLETLTRADIFVAKSRGIGKITGAIPIDNFLNIKASFESMDRAFYALKVFQKIIVEQERDEKTFFLLQEYLEAMEKAGERNENGREVLTLGFLFKLLENLGYKLEVERCAACEKKLSPERNFFAMGRGGALCDDCARKEDRKMKISDSAIKLIRIFLKNKISNFKKIKAEKKDTNNLKAVSEEAVRWIAG